MGSLSAREEEGEEDGFRKQSLKEISLQHACLGSTSPVALRPLTTAWARYPNWASWSCSTMALKLE